MMVALDFLKGGRLYLLLAKITVGDLVGALAQAHAIHSAAALSVEEA